MSDPETLPDLASRAAGGAVVYANDELFAEPENLIKPLAPVHQPYTFGHKGQVYDGWETRRRRDGGSDYVLIRLGVPGIPRRVVVDTTHFRGNFPPEISVQGCGVEGYPTPAELEEAEWEEVVPRSPIEGHARAAFDVDSARRYTHLRLCMHPDGGIARLRIHGEPIADPRWLGDRFDLAALENGGRIDACSDEFFSQPTNMIHPGLSRLMGEGWETARRRIEGNEWTALRLAAPGVPDSVEIDTSYYLGNSPAWAALSGYDARSGDPEDPSCWTEVLPKTRLQPDTRHRFRVSGGTEITHARLDIYPDGGVARLRLGGVLGSGAQEELARRWFNALPGAHARAMLAGDAGLSAQQARELAEKRPVDVLPPAVVTLLGR